MLAALDAVLLVFSALFALPSLVFFAQCTAALLPPRKRGRGARILDAIRTVVLIPAHEEEAVIGPTLTGVLGELGESDALLVVADNCTDKTAAIAREMGATVIERCSSERRGKGYALDFGLEYLAREGANPPDVVLVLDADCQIARGSLRRLAESAIEHGRPVQGDDVLAAPPAGASPLIAISAFAFLVRNRVRPTGLARLGLPCHLMGTGMAIPWSALRALPALGSQLTEDMLMGIELASRGFAPVYCPGASVRSRSPARTAAARGQRRRWEHGHLSLLFGRVPRLLARAIATRNADLFAMGLDLMVPPLSLLTILIVLGLAATFAFRWLGGSYLPLAAMGASTFLVAAAVVASWVKFGRRLLPLRHLALVPFYVLWKLPLYVSFVASRRHATWERAERT